MARRRMSKKGGGGPCGDNLLPPPIKGCVQPPTAANKRPASALYQGLVNESLTGRARTGLSRGGLERRRRAVFLARRLRPVSTRAIRVPTALREERPASPV